MIQEVLLRLCDGFIKTIELFLLTLAGAIPLGLIVAFGSMSKFKPLKIIVSDPGHVEGNAVFTYLDAFSTDDDFKNFWPEYQNLDELKEHYRRGGLGDMKCKKFLNEVLQQFLAPMRERRHEFEKDIPEVYNMLRRGTEQARAVAAETMDEVRRAMRIDYFNDAELIRQHTEMFKKG